MNRKMNMSKTICESLECTLAQLAIAWCLRLENNSCVLLGASSLEQLEEDLGAIQVMKKLNPNVLQKIDEILCNNPVKRESLGSSRNAVAMRPRVYSCK